MKRLNSSSWEGGAKGPWIWGQPGLCIKCDANLSYRDFIYLKNIQKGTQEVMNLEQGQQLRNNSLLSVVAVGEPFSCPGHPCDWSSVQCGTRAKEWLPGSCPLPGEAIESLDEVVCSWAVLLRILHQRHGGKDYIAGQEFMFEPKMNAESLHTHVLHPVKGGSNVAVTLNLSRWTDHPKAPHRSPRMWPMLRGWG